MNDSGSESTPWREDRWQGGRLRPITSGIWIWWIMGVIFGVFGSIPIITEPDIFELKFEPLKLALIFPLVALLMLARAFMKSVRYMRFSSTRIEMRSMPGVIGGQVKGDLVLPFPLERGKLDIRLFLLHSETETRGGKSSNRVRYPYSRTLTVKLEEIANGASVERIPFEFTVPYGLSDERDSAPRERYRWQLAVEGDLPGRDMEVLFDVPVYKAEESDPSITEPEERLTYRSFEAKETSPESLRHIVLEPLGTSTIFRTPIGFHYGKVLTMLIFTLIFSLPVAFLGYMAWQTLGKGLRFEGFLDLIPMLILAVQLVFALIFGLISLLLFFLTFSEFIVRRTTIERDEFVVYWRFFLYSKTIRKKVQDFASVSIHEQGSSTGEAGKRTVYYDVKAMKEGTKFRSLVLGCNIKSEDEARWMAREIAEMCGLPYKP